MNCELMVYGVSICFWTGLGVGALIMIIAFLIGEVLSRLERKEDKTEE